MHAAQRPSFRVSDIWKAPLHDLPIRDEILYQYLPLSPRMRLLEIGPGSGFTAFRLARQVKHLTLVDKAASSLARLKNALHGVGNVKAVCADVCKPGLAAAVGTQFDAVFGLDVFGLLPDPAACLKNLASVLPRGGRLLLQFPNYPLPPNQGVTVFRKREDLDRLLEEAGFERWSVYALTLNPYAGFLYRAFHERPLHRYRRLRGQIRQDRPFIYDHTWAFQNWGRLEPFKVFPHGAWTALFAAMRLGGECFDRSLLGAKIFNHNLLVLARR
jgi:SAM-dependent methyltransferase